MKKCLYSIAICICAIMMAACSSNSNTPSGVAAAYLDDLINGNYEAMLDKVTFKEEPTAEKKQEIVSALEEKAEKSKNDERVKYMTSYEITGEEINEAGDEATVKYTATQNDGSESSSEMELVKVDGKWLVDAKK